MGCLSKLTMNIDITRVFILNFEKVSVIILVALFLTYSFISVIILVALYSDVDIPNL